ncbi:preprotein translocase subunit SecG [Mariprofundus ferrooxydans]|nr:preprotein translocase subunit SecG [Mariprofundus ferrooxydans]
MTTVLLTVHIIVAILLIVVVLMQRGQEGGIGGIGGGSSQSLFGSGGSASFLVKLTGVLAAIFMLTSLSLAFFSQKDASSVLDRGITADAVQEQPIPGVGESAADMLFGEDALKKKEADFIPNAE